MKKTILSLFLLFFGLGLFAQAVLNKDAIRKATDETVALYNLDEKQAANMYVIQERRFRNLAEIEPLKEQDYQLYLQKRKAIRSGTEGSLNRMLDEGQRKIFNAQLLERRKRKSVFIKKLRLQGASKEEIQTALLEYEVEQY